MWNIWATSDEERTLYIIYSTVLHREKQNWIGTRIGPNFTKSYQIDLKVWLGHSWESLLLQAGMDVAAMLVEENVAVAVVLPQPNLGHCQAKIDIFEKEPIYMCLLYLEIKHDKNASFQIYHSTFMMR